MSRVCATLLLLSVVSAPVAFAREPARSTEVGSGVKTHAAPARVDKMPPGVLVAPNCGTACANKKIDGATNPVLDWLKAAVGRLAA